MTTSIDWLAVSVTRHVCTGHHGKKPHCDCDDASTTLPDRSMLHLRIVLAFHRLRPDRIYRELLATLRMPSKFQIDRTPSFIFQLHSCQALAPTSEDPSYRHHRHRHAGSPCVHQATLVAHIECCPPAATYTTALICSSPLTGVGTSTLDSSSPRPRAPCI